MRTITVKPEEDLIVSVIDDRVYDHPKTTVFLLKYTRESESIQVFRLELKESQKQSQKPK